MYANLLLVLAGGQSRSIKSGLIVPDMIIPGLVDAWESLTLVNPRAV